MCSSSVFVESGMLPSVGSSIGLRRLSGITAAVSAQCRNASASMLAPLGKLGSSRDLADDVKAGRSRSNKDIIASFEKIQTFEEVHYRKTDAPWELIPRYTKRRVSDMIGILQSEHRMEMEQMIERLLPIANVDLYVVIVPTVGYVTTHAFASSIMFDWAIGEPQGNGLLLVICQHEATVHLMASPAIEKWFGERFINLAVTEIFQPLVREGKPSYAILMLTYAVATHAHEVRDLSQKGLVPLPVRNKLIYGSKIVAYGATSQSEYFLGSILFACITAVLWVYLYDMKCPECGAFMCKVTNEENMQKIMTRGQWLEHKNQCAHYRVWKCGKCHKGEKVVVMSRDLHQSNKCLKCMDCDYYTCTLTKNIERLPTRHEDGLKKLTYACEHCRVGREIELPLYRPVDTKPEDQWYGFLLDRSQVPQDKMGVKAPRIDLKL